jgi:hypothetical protein
MGQATSKRGNSRLTHGVPAGLVGSLLHSAFSSFPPGERKLTACQQKRDGMWMTARRTIKNPSTSPGLPGFGGGHSEFSFSRHETGVLDVTSGRQAWTASDKALGPAQGDWDRDEAEENLLGQVRKRSRWLPAHANATQKISSAQQSREGPVPRFPSGAQRIPWLGAPP